MSENIWICEECDWSKCYKKTTAGPAAVTVSPSICTSYKNPYHKEWRLLKKGEDHPEEETDCKYCGENILECVCQQPQKYRLEIPENMLEVLSEHAKVLNNKIVTDIGYNGEYRTVYLDNISLKVFGTWLIPIDEAREKADEYWDMYFYDGLVHDRYDEYIKNAYAAGYKEGKKI